MFFKSDTKNFITSASTDFFNQPSSFKKHLDLSNHALLSKPKVVTRGFNFDQSIPPLCMDAAESMAHLLKIAECSITHLNLNYNDLGDRFMEELILIFAAVPANISHLKLKGNDLYIAGFDRNDRSINSQQAFMKIIDTLARHYKSIDLDNNSLCNLTLKKITYLVHNLSPELETLTLGWNFLGSLSDNYLIALAKELPLTLQSLSLAHNNLFASKCNASIIGILNALPDSLTFLDISEHDNTQSITSMGERVNTIFDRLKPNIRKALSYGYNKTSFIAQKIDQVLFDDSYNYKTDLEKPVQVPFIISESRLEKLVHEFEQWHLWSAFFIAGLLLEGKIQTLTSTTYSGAEQHCYHDKRLHDAITLYVKAGSYIDFSATSMRHLAPLVKKRCDSVLRPALSLSLPTEPIESIEPKQGLNP